MKVKFLAQRNNGSECILYQDRRDKCRIVLSSVQAQGMDHAQTRYIDVLNHSLKQNDYQIIALFLTHCLAILGDFKNLEWLNLYFQALSIGITYMVLACI